MALVTNDNSLVGLIVHYSIALPLTVAASSLLRFVVDGDILFIGDFVCPILFNFSPLCVLEGQVRVVGLAAVEVVREPSPVDAVATDHAVRFRVHGHVGTSHLGKGNYFIPITFQFYKKNFS